MSDLDGCRDYTDVVKRPMDLDTVRKWIEGGSYDRPISDIPSYEEVNSSSFPSLILHFASFDLHHVHAMLCRTAFFKTRRSGGVNIHLTTQSQDNTVLLRASQEERPSTGATLVLFCPYMANYDELYPPTLNIYSRAGCRGRAPGIFKCNCVQWRGHRGCRFRGTAHELL